MRVILRGGPEGEAPPADTLSALDISDIKEQRELAAAKLPALLAAALRAYREQRAFEDENIAFFLAESREKLEEVEPKLIEMEQNAELLGEVDSELVNSIFRLFHSLKGGAGFFNFNNVVRMTHEAETLLDLFRSGQAEMDEGHIDILCRACDTVNSLFFQIECTGFDCGLDDEVTLVTAELVQAIGRAAGRTEDAAGEEAAEEGPAPEFNLSPEVQQRFLQEAEEQLEKVEQGLLALEKNPDHQEGLEEAFRQLHSFKGNAGFMGQEALEQIGHGAETVLAGFKDKSLQPSDQNIPILLHVVDVLKDAVADLLGGGPGKVTDRNLLIDMLEEIAPVPQEAKEGKVRAPVQQPEAAWLLRDEKPPAAPAAPPPAAAPAPAGGNGDAAKRPAAAAAARAAAGARQDIRVDLMKLDTLINLVGELVIAESMVTRNPDLTGLELENFEKASGHLNRIVRELQDVALSVRMIPLSGVFRKMIRLVRDLSNKSGKKVNLVLLGEETEIDKTLSELIADPLVHLVRNAVDHGIEPADERIAAGKPESGQVVLEAKHAGGEVWIVLKDDGRGLNRERILEKGIERGLVEGGGEGMSDQEIYELIFHPGFSTAEKVTDVSGRGVGMDVVKKNIEQMKGRIDIKSQPGQGAVFALRIPLTLAILDGMLVRVGRARYTVPLLAIRESIQVEPGGVTITMDGQEVARVREELIPVVRLHEMYGVTPDSEKLEDGLLIILEHGGEPICLFVDEILGEQQAVIKGLSEFIGNVKGVSGCTILGDGQVSLILDVGGLITRAHRSQA
ncbi:MAG: chemotaxis protein CheA [Deltaproteobacteria bacterium]|nr:chemotaxis protein CheA [Deltaproteobacteria bacterium]